MDYEKKYKNALERARKQYNKRVPLYDIESIFPELKETESEDEKIRKAIIAYISHGQHCGVSNKDMIAWLEKQTNYIRHKDKKFKKMIEKHKGHFGDQEY